MRIQVRKVSKYFGKIAALKAIDLVVEEHELFFLLGPSGCGKTTLLRLIAGFYEADAGELFFGETVMNGTPPHRRNTGMVFQNYALWPHMTVLENVRYGLDVRGVRGSEARKRAEQSLETVQMQAYATRKPTQLSGGQQQRVALARALVIRPDVLLLDEPLSNLDAKLRLEMREEIRRIHEQTQITTIYVTHDQKEALSMAHRMALMREGAIEQLGTPREIYRRPGSVFAADFLGETNWITGKVQEAIGDEVRVETPLGLLSACAGPALARDDAVRAGFRPEAVHFVPAIGENCFEATIQNVSYLGDVEHYTLQVGEKTVFKAVSAHPAEVRKVGAKTAIHIRPRDIFLVRV